MISVIIITKNEENHIEECLRSVQWADEIIVFDSGSSDKTVEICQRFTGKIFITDWPGFGPQKNRALRKASGDWVLSIDADERVTPILQQELQSMASKIAQPYAAYRIYRQNFFCGKEIKYLRDWRRDAPIRFFKRTKASFNDSLVHESLSVDGNIGYFNAKLQHYSYDNLEQVLNKINQYSTLGAQMALKKGQKGGVWRALVHGVWSFIRAYILGCGFMDGRAGFVISVANSSCSFFKYLKLRSIIKH